MTPHDMPKRSKVRKKAIRDTKETEGSEPIKTTKIPKKLRTKRNKDVARAESESNTQPNISQADRMSAIKSVDQDLHSDLKRIRKKLNSIVPQEPIDEEARRRAESKARNRAKRIEHLQSLSDTSGQEVAERKEKEVKKKSPVKRNSRRKVLPNEKEELQSTSSANTEVKKKRTTRTRKTSSASSETE